MLPTTSKKIRREHFTRYGYLVLGILSLAVLCSCLFIIFTISVFSLEAVSPAGRRSGKAALREYYELLKSSSAEETAVLSVVLIGVLVSSIGVVWSTARAVYPEVEDGDKESLKRKRRNIGVATAIALIATFVLIVLLF